MGKKKVKRIGKRQLDNVKKSRKLIYIGFVVIIFLVVFVSVYFSKQSDHSGSQGRAVSNPCDADTCSQHSNAGNCHCHGRCDTAGCRCHHRH